MTMSEKHAETTLSATVAELKLAVELWQQSKFFQDLQAWKAECTESMATRR